jgi:hypothetical protein
MERDEGGLVRGDEKRFVEGGGEEPGLEARDAQEIVLRERDAFDGEELLRVDGRVV